LETSCILNRIC